MTLLSLFQRRTGAGQTSGRGRAVSRRAQLMGVAGRLSRPYFDNLAIKAVGAPMPSPATRPARQSPIYG